MKKTLAYILLALCAATSFGAFERLATETYPGGSEEAATKALIDSEVGGTNAVKTAVSTVTASASTWNAKYAKPTGGIPSTDLSTDVQTSLGKADSALQDATAFDAAGTATSAVTTHDTDARHIATGEKAAWNAKYDKPASGIPATDLAAAVQTSLGKADTALQDATAFDAAGAATAATNALKTVAHSGSYTDLSNKPTAADIGAATPEYVDNANSNTLAIVQTWENFLDGSNVVVSITNYISGTYSPDHAKLKILELREGIYHEVYDSRTEILCHLDGFRTNEFVAVTNAIITSTDAKIADKADKAWGQYTSAGGEAPSNTVYMTAPNTVFAGGLEYERVAVGEGMVGILTTCGAPTYTAGDEGTFKFQDDGGTNYFGFAKTDSYVIGADASGITVASSIVTITYDVTMSGVPCIWYCPSLDVKPLVWEQLNLPDGSPVPGASHVVSWETTPPAGKEICHINCPEAKGFFKATIEVAGSAKFMTNMPADLTAGIICTNTTTHTTGTIKPSFDGTSVTWSWSEL